MTDVSKRKIRVFIASPGDLAAERKAFRQVLNKLNGDFGEGRNVEFEALGWEDMLASTGPRVQQAINGKIDECDVFILVLHREWGQPAPDSRYSSYTKEEYHRALGRWVKEGAPKIFVFFKYIDPGQMGDPGPQLKKVLKFRRKLEKSRQVLYRGFLNKTQFKSEVECHLKAYAKGEAAAPRDSVKLPKRVYKELQKAKENAQQAVKRAKKPELEMGSKNLHGGELPQSESLQVIKDEASAFELVEEAFQLAEDGLIEKARQKVASALRKSRSPSLDEFAYQFYEEAGDFGDIGNDEAEIPKFLSGPLARTKRIVWALRQATFGEPAVNVRIMGSLSSFALTKVDLWARGSDREYIDWLILERESIEELFEAGASLRVLLNWNIDEFCSWKENGRGNAVARLRQLRKFVERCLEDDDCVSRARFVHTNVRDRNLLFVGDRDLFEGRKLSESSGFHATQVFHDKTTIVQETDAFDTIMDAASRKELKRISAPEQSVNLQLEDEFGVNQRLLGSLISKLNRDIARLGGVTG